MGIKSYRDNLSRTLDPVTMLKDNLFKAVQYAKYFNETAQHFNIKQHPPSDSFKFVIDEIGKLEQDKHYLLKDAEAMRLQGRLKFAVITEKQVADIDKALKGLKSVKAVMVQKAYINTPAINKLNPEAMIAGIRIKIEPEAVKLSN